MKIRPIVGAMTALLMASAFLVYRVGSQESSRTSTVRPLPETPEQRVRRKKFQASWKNAVTNSYKAKLNNGSKRSGVTLEQLPEDARAQAEQVAQQYKKSIYPALKKYTAAHNGLLPEPAFALPEFAPYMEDTQYKGTGPRVYGRGSWAIGMGLRADGTVVAHDVYSGDAADAPHDVWASFNKFANQGGLGKGFQITGWDDGRVTFDLMEQNFYGTGRSFDGTPVSVASVPGQAGIPPEAKQGLKKWMKKLGDDIQREQAEKAKAVKEQAEKDKAAKPDQPKAEAPKQ